MDLILGKKLSDSQPSYIAKKGKFAGDDPNGRTRRDARRRKVK